MILYFSGTGNSRYVAERIVKITEDEVVSINKRLKARDNSALHSSKPYVIVSPVYAGRIPRVVEKFIKEIEFKGSNKVYVVVTCSETPYRTKDYIEKLLSESSMILEGFNSVVMPQNYIVMYDIPSKKESDKIIEQSENRITEIAELIKVENQLLPEQPGTKMMSRMINPVMYATMVKAKGFYSNDKCSGCGKCVMVCPLNNIELVDGKPHWGKECTHCMACISNCSSVAIEYGKKTQIRNRYLNEKKA